MFVVCEVKNSKTFDTNKTKLGKIINTCERLLSRHDSKNGLECLLTKEKPLWKRLC